MAEIRRKRWEYKNIKLSDCLSHILLQAKKDESSAGSEEEDD